MLIKISAQESRRKKKEYVDSLERRMENYMNENVELKRKLEDLEINNKSLASQLQKLQTALSNNSNINHSFDSEISKLFSSQSESSISFELDLTENENEVLPPTSKSKRSSTHSKKTSSNILICNLLLELFFNIIFILS